MKGFRRVASCSVVLAAVAALAVAAPATALPLPPDAADTSLGTGQHSIVPLGTGARTAVPLDRRTQPVTGQPRYTVEAHGFTAVDESGPDWSGSDEVFGLFKESRGALSVTSVYGDVDSGEFRRLRDHERCVVPQRVLSTNGTSSIVGPLLWAPSDTWECDPRGVSGPINIEVTLYEDDDDHDPGTEWDPYFIRDEDDDLIGRAERSYTAGWLASRIPDVGDYTTDRITLGGPCGHPEPGEECVKHPLSSSGPEYTFHVLIRRVEDGPLEADPGQ
jgi:hypothetical protein